jgi:hypothetical protein
MRTPAECGSKATARNGRCYLWKTLDVEGNQTVSETERPTVASPRTAPRTGAGKLLFHELGDKLPSNARLLMGILAVEAEAADRGAAESGDRPAWREFPETSDGLSLLVPAERHSGVCKATITRKYMDCDCVFGRTVAAAETEAIRTYLGLPETEADGDLPPVRRAESGDRGLAALAKRTWSDVYRVFRYEGVSEEHAMAWADVVRIELEKRLAALPHGEPARTPQLPRGPQWTRDGAYFDPGDYGREPARTPDKPLDTRKGDAS